MTITASVQEQSDGNLLSWVDTGANPAGYSIERTEQFADLTDDRTTTLDDPFLGDFLLDRGADPAAAIIDYLVTGLDDAEVGTATLQLLFTFGAVDPEADAIRYTTLDKVKDRLGIDLSNTTFDTDMTAVIIAAEVAIDQHLGRSFPDPAPLGEIQSVPEAAVQVATQASVRVWKEADRAGVVSGSDDWFGELEIGASVYQVLMANPVLVGLHVSWGAGMGAT